MKDPCFESESWGELYATLTAAVDLEGLAADTKALRRRRRLREVQELLRLALAYGAGLGSLRTTAAWAARVGIAELSDVALMKRLCGAGDWLVAIFGRLLRARSGALPPGIGSRPLRLVDASCISKPGSVGTDWRLHAVFDPARQCFSELELTDAKGGECFDRFAVLPGEIRIGDRGYIGCAGLRHVVGGGGDFIIRAGWNAFRLRGPNGARFDLFAGLRRAGNQLDQWVWIEDPRHHAALKVRLVAARKSPAAAEQERRRLRQNAKRKGKTPDARSLEAAGWIILVTSLDDVPANDILALYRLRWQIELAFKRLKSLAHLDQLPARKPALARSWIAAKLIIAALIGLTIQEFLEFPPSGRRNAKAPTLDLAPLPARL